MTNWMSQGNHCWGGQLLLTTMYKIRILSFFEAVVFKLSLFSKFIINLRKKLYILTNETQSER